MHPSREPAESAADRGGIGGAEAERRRRDSNHDPGLAAGRMKTIIHFYGMYRRAGHGRRASIRIAFYRFRQYRSK
jgi:hypothetical protein